MSGFLRQSTASQSRALGPFIDDTDFITPLTGLTIANTDVELIANGGAAATKNSGGGTHRANGVYGFTFDATDTATVGELEVSILVSGALIVFDKFTVLEEAVYDALFASSAPGYLQPTTAGRTLDVSAGGEAGLDWANIGSPTTTQNLTGTTIKIANIKKNAALSAFMFMMTDSTNHNPVTGKTVAVTRSIDGASFGAGTLSAVSEVGNGIYAVDFGSGDLNGNNIILRATATGCDDTFERIITFV